MAEGTYALNPLETVQRAIQGPQLGRVVTGGNYGAGAPQLMDTPEVDRSTFDALMQLGGKALGAAIERKQQEQFLVGAQRVAQGEAVTSVIDDQPWYTEIFGPSATTQGAQTVAKIQQLDQYTNTVMNDMERLAAASPEEFAATVRQKQLETLTGDPATDAVLQTKMVEQTGPMIQAHFEANYAYKQGKMQTEVTGMMIQSSQTLQSAAQQRAKGLLNDQTFEAMRADVASTLTPIQGQSAKSYWSAVEAATMDAMAQGNHHFAGVVFESGLMDAAPPDVRKKMIDARDKYEKRTLEQVGLLEYGNDIALLQAQAKAGVISSAQLAERTLQINDKVRKQTGIQRDMLNRKDLTKMLASNYGKVYARAEKAADKQADANAKARFESERRQQILTGYQLGVGQRLVFDGHQKSEVDAVFYRANVLEKNGGADWTRSLVDNYNKGAEYVNPQRQADIRAGINSAKLEGYNGAPFQESYEAFKAMRNTEGGAAAAFAYFGKEDGAKMLKYDQLQASGVDPAVAYQASFGEPLDTSRKSSDKELTETLLSFVDKQQPGTISQWFGSIPTNEQSQRRLVTEVGKNYDMLTKQLNMNDDEAMKISMDLAKTNLDLLGPYVADRRPGAPSFANLVGASDDRAAELFSEELAKQAREQGITAPLDAAKSADGGARTLLDAITAGPAVALKNEYSRRFGDTPSTSIIRVDQFDREKGVPYAVYNVGITHDGKTTRFLLDSRELRKKYESGADFKE